MRTAPDILQYVSGYLVGTAVDSLRVSTIEQLKKDIVCKAECVFIWVKVVVQEILTQAWDGERDEELLVNTSKLPDDIMDLYDVIISTIEKSGYLNDAALWLGILNAALNDPPDAQRRHLSLIDFSYVDDGPERVFNDIGNRSNERDLITTSIGMERKLRKRCRDLIQIHEHGIYGNEKNHIMPVHKRYCLLLHSSLGEYMKTESWKKRLPRLGNAANEEHIQVSLMNVYLRQAQQDPYSNTAHFRNMFAHARLYELASGSAATPFLELLYNILEVHQPAWCRKYLSREDWILDMPNILSLIKFVSYKDADILSIAVYHGVHLFVKAKLEGLEVYDVQQPLLHMAFGPFFGLPPYSLEVLETLLQNGFPVNSTMPTSGGRLGRYKGCTLLDTALQNSPN